MRNTLARLLALITIVSAIGGFVVHSSVVSLRAYDEGTRAVKPEDWISDFNRARSRLECERPVDFYASDTDATDPYQRYRLARYALIPCQIDRGTGNPTANPERETIIHNTDPDFAVWRERLKGKANVTDLGTMLIVSPRDNP